MIVQAILVASCVSGLAVLEVPDTPGADVIVKEWNGMPTAVAGLKAPDSMSGRSGLVQAVVWEQTILIHHHSPIYWREDDVELFDSRRELLRLSCELERKPTPSSVLQALQSGSALKHFAAAVLVVGRGPALEWPEEAWGSIGKSLVDLLGQDGRPRTYPSRDIPLAQIGSVLTSEGYESTLYGALGIALLATRTSTKSWQREGERKLAARALGASGAVAEQACAALQTNVKGLDCGRIQGTTLKRLRALAGRDAAQAQ